MSGLLSGCHAIAFDGSRVKNLDGFAAVPSSSGELAELADSLRRRARRVRDRPCVLRGSRAARCARRAVGSARPPAVEPAVRACARPRAHRDGAARDARALPRDARRAVRARARRRPLRARRSSPLRGRPAAFSRGSSRALEALAEEGAASVYRGSIAEELLRVAGVVLSRGGSRAVPSDLARPGARPVLRPADRDPRRALGRARAAPPASAAGRLGRDGARARARRGAPRRRTSAASTRRTWSRSTRTAAPAPSPTRWASAPASGSPASTHS